MSGASGNRFSHRFILRVWTRYRVYPGKKLLFHTCQTVVFYALDLRVVAPRSQKREPLLGGLGVLYDRKPTNWLIEGTIIHE